MKMLQGSVSYDSDAVNRTDSEYAFFRGDGLSFTTGTQNPFYDPDDFVLRRVIKDPPAADGFANFENVNGQDQYPQTTNSDFAVNIRQSGIYSINGQYTVNDITRQNDFFANATQSNGVLLAVRFEIIVRATGGNMLSFPQQWNEGNFEYRVNTNTNMLSSQGHSTVHIIQRIVANTFITGQLRWYSTTTGTNKQSGSIAEPSASGVTPINANYFSFELLTRS